MLIEIIKPDSRFTKSVLNYSEREDQEEIHNNISSNPIPVVGEY